MYYLNISYRVTVDINRNDEKKLFRKKPNILRLTIKVFCLTVKYVKTNEPTYVCHLE